MVSPGFWASLKTKRTRIVLLITLTVFIYMISINSFPSSSSLIPASQIAPQEPTTELDVDVKPINNTDDNADPERNGYRTLPPHMSAIFPPPDAERKKTDEWNAQSLAELHACMALKNCGPNQEKIALLASDWFGASVVRGWRGGEGIWGISVYKHLRAMGYTTLFSISFEEALDQYRLFPDLVKVVLRSEAGECHSEPKCVKGPTNPSGIPAWKIFDFEFFSSTGGHFHASLMKGKWILSATLAYKDEPNPPQYIGYSIEDECRETAPIPLAKRHDRVWMLMKQLSYLYDDNFAWNRSYFSLASEELKVKFTGVWQIDQHYGGWNAEKNGPLIDVDKEPGVEKLGWWMGPEDFARELGMSRVLLGMGNPWWSPSPYNALCMGVPFLNPILRWDENDPWNKTRWHTQHPTLQKYDPPYVYNVHKHDYEGFVAAIRAATQTEIPSFIPSHMTELAVRGRLQQLMETDWKAAAQVLLEERLKEAEEGGKPYIFEI